MTTPKANTSASNPIPLPSNISGEAMVAVTELSHIGLSGSRISHLKITHSTPQVSMQAIELVAAIYHTCEGCQGCSSLVRKQGGRSFRHGI